MIHSAVGKDPSIVTQHMSWRADDGVGRMSRQCEVEESEDGRTVYLHVVRVRQRLYVVVPIVLMLPDGMSELTHESTVLTFGMSVLFCVFRRSQGYFAPHLVRNRLKNVAMNYGRLSIQILSTTRVVLRASNDYIFPAVRSLNVFGSSFSNFHFRGGVKFENFSWNRQYTMQRPRNAHTLPSCEAVTHV